MTIVITLLSIACLVLAAIAYVFIQLTFPFQKGQDKYYEAFRREQKACQIAEEENKKLRGEIRLARATIQSIGKGMRKELDDLINQLELEKIL